MLLGVFCGACQHDQPESFSSAPGASAHPVTIHEPAKLSSIETEERDLAGRPVRVACATCHSLRPAGALPRSADELNEFHVGLSFSHGDLGCRSCHEEGKHDQLHLANGERIPMKEAMAVCAQCHGQQFRDYRKGAHGGMSGHWDLSRGPRLRNHCVDCHDPHTPRYVGMQPAFKPRDRIAPVGPARVARGAP